MKHLDQLRTLAAPYAAWLQGGGQQCCEPPTDDAAIGNEFALQALWNSQTFDGVALALPDGTPVEVIEPGRWNHADGPDFCDAVVMIGGEMRRGNVECHVAPTDWDVHGHATDPAYGGLILHVTWFADPPAKNLPKRVPQLALKPLLPFDSLTSGTLASRDAQWQGRERPCLARFRDEPLALDRTLVAAGYYRLLAKTNRFIEGLQAENPTQVFYECLMVAMGYSRNSEPFRRLAKEVPLAMLEPFPTKTRFAILARVAGLLKENQRDLWDLWWESGLRPPLEPYQWTLKGLRPQNHPYKRLAGGLGIVHHLGKLLETSLEDLPEAITQAADFLREDLGTKVALVGAKRAAAVTLNLFVPYRLALGTLSERSLMSLPSEDVSMPMRDTWQRLTGRTTHLPTDGLRQQGLLQIYSDFCHNPRFLCETCPLGQAEMQSK